MRLLVCLAILIAASVSTRAQDQPSSPGQELLKSRCLACHQTDLIEQQQLTKGGWEREIDKMVRWGARIDAPERETLSAYLTTQFGAPMMTAHQDGAKVTGATAEAPGQAVFRRACLSCHGQDLVEQQRLTRPGWGREVEKMIRWGASVPDADKDALVSFLTSRHGVSAGSR